jgi:adenine-specific DNA-methyltransferase
VRVDEKPEVRKAGGVYYTPQYIVKYIVENTIGKMIAGKTPEQIAKLRFADISCGSGSFLLEVFDTLLDYHLRYYNANPSKTRKDDCVEHDGVLHLSLKKRREILLNNVYGVDIDAQAVEVAQLSLYLKLLEEETIGTTHDYQQEFHQTLLPSLSKNIVCGNSLIGTDILTSGLFPGEEERKLNAMDFEARFPEIMRDGGFDAIVGNPPYGAEFTFAGKIYFQSRYVYRKGKPETYIYFMERGLKILKNGGKLGFITPNAWLTNFYGAQLRRFVFNTASIDLLVDLEPTRVFIAAVVDTVITILSKSIAQAGTVTRIFRGTKDRKIVPYCNVDQCDWNNKTDAIINLQANPAEAKLIESLEKYGKCLDQFMEYSQGVIPYKTKKDGKANAYIAAKPRDTKWLPLLENAAQVKRYYIESSHSYVKYGPWLWCARDARFFSQPKILFHRLRKKLPVQLVGGIDESGVVNRHSLSNLILRPGTPPKILWAILGIFNSTLANWWFVKRFGLLMEVGGFKVTRLPLPQLWQEGQSQLTLMVETMLAAKKQLSEAKTDKDKTYYEQKCAALDRQIDELIYKLYELDEKDIQIIEGHLKKEK